MAWYGLNSKMSGHGIHKGLTMQEIADSDPGYIEWLHNSRLNVWIGKSVWEYMGLWGKYKNTDKCKKKECLNK